MIEELEADVYLLGEIETIDVTDMLCHVSLWGTIPPHYYKWDLESFELKEKTGGTADPVQWRLNLSKSGLDFFTRVVVPGQREMMAVQEGGNLVDVIFLTQPLCDDLNSSWQIRADGLVYDMRKETRLLSKRGQVMQSRVKSLDALKERSYVIKEFSLVIETDSDTAIHLEPYVLPKGSDYYFVPFEKGNSGLRFLYLWAKHGKTKKLSRVETGMGWKLLEADKDWPNKLEAGYHVATAHLEPTDGK